MRAQVPEPRSSTATSFAPGSWPCSARSIGPVDIRMRGLHPVSSDINDLIARMERMEGDLVARADPRRYFHSTYLRTTRAVADEIAAGGFVDPEWVERW